MNKQPVRLLLLNHLYNKSDIFVAETDENLVITDANAYAHTISGNNIIGSNLKNCLVEFQPLPDISDITEEGSQFSLNYRSETGLPCSFRTSIYKTPCGFLVIGEHISGEFDSLRVELISINNQLNSLTRELHRKNAELENISRVKNQFLGIVCHDLRTPLSSMGMLCQILQDDMESMSKDELLKYLVTVQSQIRFMEELIGDVLDISVIESGSLTLRREVYNLADEIMQFADTYRLFANKVGVELILDIEADQINIFADRNKIKQVFDNIVGNAIKYSDKGQILSVKLKTEGEKVLIEISDSGPGIPCDRQCEIFQPFSTYVVKTPRGERSSGLGLAISKKIVDAHNGDIRLVSTSGAGSVFTVVLDIHS